MNFKEFTDLEDTFQKMMMLEGEDLGSEYAMSMLDKLDKIAAYLIKTKLQKPADVLRFKKFISMVEKEIPNLSKSAQRINQEIKDSYRSHVSAMFKY